MNKLLLSAVALSIALATGPSHGEPPVKTNLMLAYTMKAISQDEGTIQVILKKPTPAQVTDAMVLGAITRARTAAYQLQLVSDRAGTFEGEKFTPGELAPPGIEDVPEVSLKEHIATYSTLLIQAKQLFEMADGQLQTELKIANPAERDYRPLAKTMTAVGNAMKEAHMVFKPKKPMPGDEE